MRKFLLVLFIFFLLPIGLGIELNFTGTNHSLLAISATPIIGRIKAYNYNSTTWFYTYQKFNVANNRYYEKSDELFTSLTSVNYPCNTTETTCEFSDCSIYNGGGITKFNCMGSSKVDGGGFYFSNLFDYYMNNETFTWRSNGIKDGSSHYVIQAPTDNSYSKFWTRNNSGDNLHYDLNSYTFGLNLTGDGILTLPTYYKYPNDTQSVYCGDAYHIFINNHTATGGSKVYDLIYDSSLNYKGVQLIKGSDWFIEKYDFSVSTDGNNIYYVAVNHTGTENLIEFMKIKCEADYTDSIVYYYQQLQNETYGTDGSHYIKSPYLTIDVNGRAVLFYSIVGTNGIQVSYDNSCLCSDWTGTSECSSGYQKYIRTCTPYGCDTNTSYWTETTYCGTIYNETQGIYNQSTRQVSNCQQADTSLLTTSANPSIRADVSLSLPFNCSNIKVNASYNLYVLASDSVWRTNKNNFTASICNPLSSCVDTTTYYCEDAYYSNLTFKKSWDYYNTGETAKAAFMVTGSPCAVTNNFFGYEGWRSYGVIGSICYTCDLLCGGSGGYKCETRGLIQYSVFENPDCSTNTTKETECSYGCDSSTGLCKSLTTGSGKDITPMGVIEDWFLAPDATKKVLYGLVLSLTFGFVMLTLSSNLGLKDPITFIIGFAVGFILFSFMGWIPIIFSVIIVFMVGVFGLLKFIK